MAGEIYAVNAECYRCGWRAPGDVDVYLDVSSVPILAHCICKNAMACAERQLAREQAGDGGS